MAEWDVASPAGAATKLQMAFIERRHDPVVMDIGPVLHLKDAVGSKICALASRVMTRDYIDAAAAMQRFSIGELIDLARGLDPASRAVTLPMPGCGSTGWRTRVRSIWPHGC